jgi:hypothetical protein
MAAGIVDGVPNGEVSGVGAHKICVEHSASGVHPKNAVVQGSDRSRPSQFGVSVAFVMLQTTVTDWGKPPWWLIPNIGLNYSYIKGLCLKSLFCGRPHRMVKITGAVLRWHKRAET